MSKKLLIDARQSDETRIVVLNNSKLEDFDHETSHRKQLKGNVYLARVTRVEPSLQAAFIEYGGNRQGFLAFSEIHPDYYRIPIEDREKLLAEEDDSADAADESTDSDESAAEDLNSAEDSDDIDDVDARALRRKYSRITKHYKIQEVISNRQILLVQVVKEERGNKGAALTTYISLAGRYCVLMANTLNSGGVSRKISNLADRKKLKTIVGGLDVPKGNAVIVRTAGSKRTKAEITRDFTYLLRQWDDIRALTMESSAPSLIHEEGNLLKRSIRDHYSTDVDEILVEGEDAYKAAKDHMRNLMPSHVKKVKAYEDEALPLFQRYQIEAMLSAMHEPQVRLKSGGYLVINQTEALVAIDVNSGRATKERNIEETARITNLEAAEEIATQLRQRDLSGLIVIDFIDMEISRNQHAVERKLKEALKSDRARIQVGSISQFGLLEMSRQRLRPSLAESVTNICPHCDGTGRIRSVESAALQVLRTIEAEALKTKGQDLKVFMAAEIAIYILNHKHDMVIALKERFEINITLEQDNSLIAPSVRFGDDGAPPSRQQDTKEPSRRRGRGRQQDRAEVSNEAPKHPSDDEQKDEDKSRRRRGKRGGRRRRGRDQSETSENQTDQNQPDQNQSDQNQSGQSQSDQKQSDQKQSDQNQSGQSRANNRRRAAPKTAPETAHEDTAEEAPKAKKAVTKKKSAKKTAQTTAKTTKAKTEAVNANETVKAKKTATKKSAKKTQNIAADTDTGTPSVKKKAPKASSKKASGNADNNAKSRKSSSSAAVNVVDVSNVSTAFKKKGWWQ